MERLAIHGGVPVRTDPFPGWPVFDEQEKTGLLAALEGKVRGRAPLGAEFQALFAASHEAVYGVA